MPTATWSATQRLHDAERVLRALGASPEQVEALAPRVAAGNGPIGQIAGRMLQRCR